jgi:hypothetical protein
VCHFLDGVAHALAADAALLHAAVRHMVGAEGGDIVDNDPAEIKVPDGFSDLLHIAAEHPGLQAINGIIGHA